MNLAGCAEVSHAGLPKAHSASVLVGAPTDHVISCENSTKVQFAPSEAIVVAGLTALALKLSCASDDGCIEPLVFT